MLQSLLLHSQDLGHPCTRTRREFKPLGPGLEPLSPTWESSDIAIMLTAGPGREPFKGPSHYTQNGSCIGVTTSDVHSNTQAFSKIPHLLHRRAEPPNGAVLGVTSWQASRL